MLGIALFIPYAAFFALLLSAIWIIVTGLVLAGEPSERSDAAVTSVA